VDETRTEAAAATGAAMVARGMLPRAVDFRADHPFLFFIRDTASEQILFAGRVVKPTT
jgi:serpin B